MFSGQITNQEYAIYLKQQYESYKALETRFENLAREDRFPPQFYEEEEN